MEGQNSYTQDTPNLPIIGLDLDTSPEKLSQGDYTFMLNGVDETSEGNKGSSHNELGNVLCYTLPSQYELVGHVYMGRGKVLVFSHSIELESSEIGLATDCEYTTLINDPCLNFSLDYTITGTHRIRRGCEDVVYWQDGNNPDRYLNVTSFLAEDCKDFDCNNLRLTPKVAPVCLELKEVLNYGGDIRSGRYYFQLEVLDSSSNSVYKTPFSQAIPIYKDSTNASYPTINGNYNIDEYLEEIGGANNSNKSVVFSISNLDTRFAYYRIVVLSYTNGDDLTRSAHTTELQTISNTEATYTYTGYNPSKGHFLLDADEALIPPIKYDTSEALEQVNNRLVRVNVKESVRDYSEYQKYASQIASKFVTKECVLDEAVTTNSKSPNTYWRDMSHMPDEIEALGIVFINDDYSESPSFHIPGRAKNTNPINCNDLPSSGSGASTTNTFGLYVSMNNQYVSQCPITFTIKYSLGPFGVNIQEETLILTQQDQLVVSSTEAINVLSFSWTPHVCQVNGANVDITLYYEILDEGINLNSGNNIIPVAVNGWDSTIIDADHVDNYLNLDVERWQIFNTAFKLTTDSGLMGYHESASGVYDKPSSCCVENYWGVDSCGNILEGTPLRHHRFPDSTLLCEDVILGVQFSNIEYPPGVIGHYFVKAQRSDADKTVLSTGLLGNMKVGESKELEPTIGFTYFTRGTYNSKYCYFLSPEVLYNGAAYNGCYLKIDRERISNISLIDGAEVDGAGNAAKEVDTAIVSREYDYTDSDCFTPSMINVGIVDSILMPPLGEQRLGDYTLMNFSQSNRVNYLELDRNLELLSSKSVYIATVKSCADVFSNVHSLRYERMHNCTLDLVTGLSPIYGGDTFYTELSLSNILAYEFNDGIAGDVVKVMTILVSTVIGVLTAGVGTVLATAAIAAGAIGITAAAAVAVIDNLKKGRFRDFLDDSEINDKIDDLEGDAFDWSDYIAYVGEHIGKLHIHSRLNTNLRNQGTRCNDFFQEGTFIEYVKDKVLYYDQESGSFAPKPIICPEFYEYNKDFNGRSSDTTYFPVAQLFNFCSQCIGEYPNRVVWSPIVDDVQNINDTYLITLVNDYKDFPAHRGEFTGIKYKGQNLLLHAKESTFIVRPNPQTIQLDTTEVYLGTGTFLGVPEQELTTSDLGYAGKQTKHDSINTLSGYTWVDRQDGRIFNFTDSLEEISNYKMSQWLGKNLPLQIDSKEYNLSTGTAAKPNWLMASYNPLLDRYVLHVKDFIPKYPIIAAPEGQISILDYEHIQYDGDKYYYPSTSTTIQEGLSNEEFFCNASYTISYSYEDKRWKSWHSYFPDWSYYNNETFFTSISGKVLKHQTKDSKYQVFNNIKYDYIVELPVNNIPQTTDKHAIHWYGDAQLYDKVNNTWVHHPDITFNKLWLYNSTQSTGLQDLVVDSFENPYANITWSNTLKHVKVKDDMYMVDQLRDITTQAPTYSAACRVVQGQYVGKSPININYDTPLHLLGDIKDKHASLRLYFTRDIKEDYKITTHLVNTKTHHSKR